MTHIVCLLDVESDSATFTWQAGGSSFKPYSLKGLPLKRFKKHAETIREKLANLVSDCEIQERKRYSISQLREGKSSPDELKSLLQASPEFVESSHVVSDSSYELAKAGFRLYEQIFQPAAGENDDIAEKVRRWLEALRDKNQVESLEIVLEYAWSLPWNFIYDQKPEQGIFEGGDSPTELWKPFWGIRYNLACGLRVDPQRRMPFFEEPDVLVVVDEAILPENELVELRASYAHLVKLRDEVIDMGLLPPLGEWTTVNPNLG